MKKLLFYIFIAICAFYISFNIVSPDLTAKYLGFKGYTIASDSMVKSGIKSGDIVFVKRVAPQDLSINDIIAFKVNDKKEVLHHIASIVSKDGVKQYRTKHAQAQSEKDWDYWKIHDGQIIGKYWFTIPFIGHFLIYARTWYGLLSIVVCLICAYLIYRLNKRYG